MSTPAAAVEVADRVSREADELAALTELVLCDRTSAGAPSADPAAESGTSASGTGGTAGGSRSRTAANPRQSATGARVTSAEFTDRAVAAWQPGTDVSPGWVQQAAGCGRTVAYQITPAVRDRVAAGRTSGVVVEFANREATG